MCVLVAHLCRLFANPWILACQVPLSMRFSRQEYCSGLPVPSPGDLPDPGTEPRSPMLQADSLPSVPTEKPPIPLWVGNYHTDTPILMMMESSTEPLSNLLKATQLVCIRDGTVWSQSLCSVPLCSIALQDALTFEDQISRWKPCVWVATGDNLRTHDDEEVWES